MIKNISQNISIEAQYLDNKIKEHIFNKLKNIYEGTCSLDNGYILNINKIVELGDNKIGGANSLAIFDVIYEATILNPTEGQLLSGKVCMVFQHGIFVDVYNKMKVLVPASSMIEYSYNQDEKIFIHNNSKNVLKNGLDITINIVKTKYEKKQFSCIGKIHNVAILENNNEDT